MLLLYDLACFFLNQEFYELLWLSVSYIFTFLECLLVLAIILVVLLFYFCIACTFLYCIKFRSSDALISLYFFEYSYLKIIIALLTVQVCGLALCAFFRMIWSRRLVYDDFILPKRNRFDFGMQVFFA